MLRFDAWKIYGVATPSSFNAFEALS